MSDLSSLGANVEIDRTIRFPEKVTGFDARSFFIPSNGYVITTSFFKEVVNVTDLMIDTPEYTVLACSIVTDLNRDGVASLADMSSNDMVAITIARLLRLQRGKKILYENMPNFFLVRGGMISVIKNGRDWMLDYMKVDALAKGRNLFLIVK